jgi:SAM-dependent methyltransferase
MDVGDSANPAVLSAERWLARVNARHPWNHNEHFHGWILRNLPARRRSAVDVGCGTGVLVGRLAPASRVTGIDADEGMAAAAGVRLAGEPRVSIRGCRFEEFIAGAGEGEADLITMVAVLHHLDLNDALARIPRLLAPGGRLLIVGLAKVNSPADAMVDLMSAVANPVMGLIKHPPASPPGRWGRSWSARHASPRSRYDRGRDRRGCQRPPAGRRNPPPAVLPLHPSVGKAMIRNYLNACA